MNIPSAIINSYSSCIFGMQGGYSKTTAPNFFQFHQKLAKKILQGISQVSSINLQTRVFSWMKGLDSATLVKICSINAKWFIEVLHELIRIYNYNVNYNFSLIYAKEDEKKENEFQSIITDDTMHYSNYFIKKIIKGTEMTKKNFEQEKVLNFLKEIKYLTIKTEKNEINSIISFSFSYVANYDTFKALLMKISNNNIFKYPLTIIQIKNKNELNTDKIFYNYFLSYWVTSEKYLTLPEIIIGYIEINILINFYYVQLYKEICPFDHYEKIQEIYDNAVQIANFISNSEELYSRIDYKAIAEKYKNQKNEFSKRRRQQDEWIDKDLNENRFHSKEETIKLDNDIINEIKVDLYKCYREGNAMKFVERLLFIEDGIAFYEEDFVRKNIYEILMNLYSSYNADLLMNEGEKENEEEKGGTKKKKKKKKNKKDDSSGKEAINKNDSEKSENSIKEKEIIKVVESSKIVENQNANENSNNTIKTKNNNKNKFHLFPVKVKKQKDNINNNNNNTNNKRTTVTQISIQHNETFELCSDIQSNSTQDTIMNMLSIYNPIYFLSYNLTIFSDEIEALSKLIDNNKRILNIYKVQILNKLKDTISLLLSQQKDLSFEIAFYGSYITGLSIENSDIDILIKLKTKKDIKHIMQEIVKGLTNINEKEENPFDIFPIYTASVPVIKLNKDITHLLNKYDKANLETNNYFDLEYYNAKYDATFFIVDNTKTHLPSQIIVEYIKESLVKYPELKKLLYIFKKLMYYARLNSSYAGGLSSYSLFLLLISFMKICKKDTLGNLLIQVLLYYANFQFDKYHIDPKKDNPFILSNEQRETPSIIILDPVTGMNVAKSSFQVDQIKFCFAKSAEYILSRMYMKYSIITMQTQINNINILPDLFSLMSNIMPQ